MSTTNRPITPINAARANQGKTVDAENLPHTNRFVRWLRSSLDLESSDSQAVKIAPWAFLQSMFAIAWVSIRHPLSTTAIDLTTGRVVQNV